MASVVDIVQVLEFQCMPGTGFGFQRNVNMTGSAVGGISFVIVKQVNVDDTIVCNILPDRRRIFESRIDKHSTIDSCTINVIGFDSIRS